MPTHPPFLLGASPPARPRDPDALFEEATERSLPPAGHEDFRLDCYRYHLPSELIAQTPAEPRDSARLLVLHREIGAARNAERGTRNAKPTMEHRRVWDLPSLLEPGDLLVANRSRVLPCRLLAKKAGSGGRVELLLLRPLDASAWECLVGGHRLRAGQCLELGDSTTARIEKPIKEGWAVRFEDGEDVADLLQRHGTVPLPPYIRSYTGDPERYQTVYADTEGSAAAPTAGLHFTPSLMQALTARGIMWQTIVLHIGLDTFKPIVEEDVRDHRIHTEWTEVPEAVVEAVAETRARGGRVVAVGTTTVRALEHAAAAGELRAFRGAADLYIMPGYKFRVVDAMLTNFHLPHSSLLLLVSAFAGRGRILRAYEEAVRLRYRFYSFGDAMLLL